MSGNAEGPARFEDHDFPQRIPVPDHIKSGAPAPWSNLTAEERRSITLDTVIDRLRMHHRLLDVTPFPDEPLELSAVADAPPQAVTKRSAVLVALFEEEGETHVILTRRSFALRNHSGEIALPGGRSEGDETPLATALRETHEEVGIDPTLVDPIGWLNPIVSFVSASSIWPVVGVLSARPSMTIDPVEVSRAFTVALADLLADGAFVEERWRREDTRPGSDAEGYFPIYFFAVPGDIIWGATARVLTELLCLVTGVEWPDANRQWG